MNHIHEPFETKTVGYEYPVPKAKRNARAHGGVTHLETCACGAKRRVNSTGPGRDEVGPWVEAPKPSAAKTGGRK